MADTFRKLVDGINPPATTETEWFEVPIGHEYQGTIRVAHVGGSGSGSTSFRFAGVSATGVSPVKADWEAYDTELNEGDVLDFTIDLTSGEAVVVYAADTNVSFNFRGLDMVNA